MNRWALLAAALTGVQVGAALVGSAAVVAELGAARLGLWRYLVALLVLLPLLALSRWPRMAHRDLPVIVLIGVAQFGVLIVLLNLAVWWTGAARVALVFALLPLAARWLGGLRSAAAPRPATARREALAFGVTLGGLGLLLGSEALAGDLGWHDAGGLAAAAAATLIAAGCAVASPPYLQRYGVVPVGVLAMAAAVPALALMAWLEAALTAAVPVPWTAASAGIVALVGLSSGIGWLWWMFALRGLDTAVATAFLALGPVTAALLAHAAGIEPLTPLRAAGVLLVAGALAGVSLAARGRRAQLGV